MDERMTVCNMSIEAGARAGMIAPDETTFEYLQGRPLAPQGAAWDAAVADWNTLRSDAGAVFDKSVRSTPSTLEPMITFGTNPGMVTTISGNVPERPGDAVFAQVAGLHGPRPRASALAEKPVQVVFIGSCTNARLSDLRSRRSHPARTQGRHGRARAGRARLAADQAAKPKRAAWRKIFTDAGAEWRESGCSMCLGMNGDLVDAGQYCVSTSNRNFEGRQGIGARTLLASPATAAAAAVRGRVTDPREFLG